jgi:hypothetical protein
MDHAQAILYGDGDGLVEVRSLRRTIAKCYSDLFIVEEQAEACPLVSHLLRAFDADKLTHIVDKPKASSQYTACYGCACMIE